MRQFTRPTPPVKPTRVSARPDTPFGFGLTRYTAFPVPVHGFAEPSPEDQAWYAETLAASGHPTEQVTMERRAFGSREMTDEEFDRIAMEREWEMRYEQGVAAGDRCSLCGLASDALVNAMCPACQFALDADLDIEPRPAVDGGVCPVCRRAVDFLEPSGLCCPCDLLASDASFSGNHGY